MTSQGVAGSRPQYYLLARNATKEQVQTFALSRFRRIEATGDTFARPADFNAGTYARQAFGTTQGPAAIRGEAGDLHHGTAVAPDPGAAGAKRRPRRDTAGDHGAEGLRL